MIARKLVAPLLDPPLTEILAVEVEKIEGDETGLPTASLGAQSGNIGASVRTEHDRVAVD